MSIRLQRSLGSVLLAAALLAAPTATAGTPPSHGDAAELWPDWLHSIIQDATTWVVTAWTAPSTTEVGPTPEEPLPALSPDGETAEATGEEGDVLPQLDPNG